MEKKSKLINHLRYFSEPSRSNRLSTLKKYSKFLLGVVPSWSTSSINLSTCDTQIIRTKLSYSKELTGGDEKEIMSCSGIERNSN